MFCKIILVLTVIVSFFGSLAAIPVRGQAPTALDESDRAVMERLTALRDSFVSQIKAEGFQPGLPAPTIVLDNPPSFGDYEDGKNLLHIAAWSALTPEEQARFSRIAAMLGQGQSGEALFEDGIHHWVFVHELGHWWQACQGKLAESHYSVEYGANRVAAAYWRLKDPGLMDRTAKRMATLMVAAPDPVPEGQNEQSFFNENYEKLGPTPAYRWFQEKMVFAVQAEKPLPSFQQALQHPTYP